MEKIIAWIIVACVIFFAWGCLLSIAIEMNKESHGKLSRIIGTTFIVILSLGALSVIGFLIYWAFSVVFS